MNNLRALEACGQSPWLDFVLRSHIANGTLAHMVEQDGLKGVTSNPSIFEKAIGRSDEYVDQMRGELASEDLGVSQLYDAAVIADIQAGADVLRTVYDATGARDGYISLEVAPYMAHDTDATVAEARRLWKLVGRPNLMVKVPATPEGIPAIRALIADGVNINVTLLFANTAYEQVARAFIAGLAERSAAGKPVERIASVASFFVSRIDALVEKKLGDKAKAFEGKVAIANAKLAYELYGTIFAGGEWEALAAKGAQTQRLLWASTSTKSKSLPDTLYVDALIGRDTVNTIPPATWDAFRDHGHVVADAVTHGLDDARKVLADLTAAGVSLDEVTGELLTDGVRLFADAFDSLQAAVAKRRRELTADAVDAMVLRVPETLTAAYDAEMERWRAGGLIRRLWLGDASLWTGRDEASWTGWLTIIDRADLAGLKRLATEAREFRDVLLLGMGGSSLGPETIALTYGQQPGMPKLHVLDSTDPAQVKSTVDACDLTRTLVVVSSKSGSTLEPNIFAAYVMGRMREAVGERAASHFVAVTDPGSSLERDAKAAGYRHVFLGDKTIGGRYSVLSAFGLVPAAAIGVDIEALLAEARRMARACGADVPPSENPGVQLGVLLGVAARAHRDKVTIQAAPGVHALGAWLEQLIAESTGKLGRGLIPVDGEMLASPDSYGADRVFVLLDTGSPLDGDALFAAGHPVAQIAVREPARLGQEFLRWEIATAVAGAVLNINPFDQPDVEAAKIATRKLTSAYEESGALPQEQPAFSAGGISVYGDVGGATDLKAALAAIFGQVTSGDYVAILAFIDRDEGNQARVQAMREAIRDRLHVATCVGFGPRFLHSTGQAYKGGPASGVFLQITGGHAADVAIPEHKYTFGVVVDAQAAGDLAVLHERGRRALRVHLHDVPAGLNTVAEAVVGALSNGG